MNERPLSPHLQVYRPQITTVLSVMHRATGIALCAALAVLLWWLLALASGPEAYDTFRAVVGSPLGVFVMAGLSFALFFHLCTGIRHLFLDTGAFFSIPEIYKTGYATLAATVILTVCFWLAIIF